MKHVVGYIRGQMTCGRSVRVVSSPWLPCVVSRVLEADPEARVARSYAPEPVLAKGETDVHLSVRVYENKSPTVVVRAYEERWKYRKFSVYVSEPETIEWVLRAYLEESSTPLRKQWKVLRYVSLMRGLPQPDFRKLLEAHVAGCMRLDQLPEMLAGYTPDMEIHMPEALRRFAGCGSTPDGE